MYKIRSKLLNFAINHQNKCSVWNSVNPTKFRTASFFFLKPPRYQNHHFSWFWYLAPSLTHICVTRKSLQTIFWGWKNYPNLKKCMNYGHVHYKTLHSIMVGYLTVHNSHNQQVSTNPWINWALSQPNLNLDPVCHNQQKSTNPWIGWVGIVLFVVTDCIQGY